MGRLFLAMFAVSFALCASTITSSSCTAGTTTDTPCPGNADLTTGLSGPNYFVSAFARASDVPGSISAMAEATAFYTSCLDCPKEPPLFASAQALVSDTYETSGPVRSGFMKLNVTIYSLHGNPATGDVITDGPYTYTGCPPGSVHGAEGCSGTAFVPFELGIPFTVYAGVPSTPIDIALSPGKNGFGAQDQVTITFSLFEPNRSTPVAFSAVPEPSTYGLLLVAIAPWLIRLRRCA